MLQKTSSSLDILVGLAIFSYIGRSCAIFQLNSLFGLELCYLHTSRQLQNTLSFIC